MICAKKKTQRCCMLHLHKMATRGWSWCCFQGLQRKHLTLVLHHSYTYCCGLSVCLFLSFFISISWFWSILWMGRNDVSCKLLKGIKVCLSLVIFFLLSFFLSFFSSSLSSFISPHLSICLSLFLTVWLCLFLLVFPSFSNQ